MTTLAEDALRQFDDLLADLDERQSRRISAYELATRMAAAIERFAPPGSTYRARAAQALDNANDIRALARISGVLRALRTDYELGNLRTAEQVVCGLLEPVPIEAAVLESSVWSPEIE